MPKTRRAFTLLELLVVIAVIAVLIGLLVFGASKMIGGGKAQATRVTLSALQGMLAEFDAKTRMSKSPQAWTWYDRVSGNVVVQTPTVYTDPVTQQRISIDFWNYAWLTPPPPNPPRGDALDAPGYVGDGEDDGANLIRNGSRHILNTESVMAMLLSVPANRSSLEKIAADQQFTPAWVGGLMSSPGSDGVLYSQAADFTSSSEPVKYLIGDRMQYDGKRYLCIATHDSTTTVPQPPTPPPASNWIVDSTPAAPLLRDGWRNPIIFVPATGLRVRLLNAASKYYEMGSTIVIPTDVKTAIIVSPEGKVGTDASGNPVVLQPGRPFWASAGPDGDFAKGDDNIYSFEK